MKPEIKQRWIEALCSGAYQQTQGELRSVQQPDCYCCLGVLTDLYLRDTQQDWMLQAGLDEHYPAEEHYACHNDYLGLQPEVLTWAGLHDRNPIIVHDDECLSLTELNDDEGLSFSEIAHLISEQL